MPGCGITIKSLLSILSAPTNGDSAKSFNSPSRQQNLSVMIFSLDMLWHSLQYQSVGRYCRRSPELVNTSSCYSVSLKV